MNFWTTISFNNNKDDYPARIRCAIVEEDKLTLEQRVGNLKAGFRATLRQYLIDEEGIKDPAILASLIDSVKP